LYLAVPLSAAALLDPFLQALDYGLNPVGQPRQLDLVPGFRDISCHSNVQLCPLAPDVFSAGTTCIVSKRQ
jgi:hypothetical protein